MKPPLITLEQFCDALPAPLLEGQEARAKTVAEWVSAFARREAKRDFMLPDGTTLGPVPDDVVAVVTQAAVRTWMIRTGVLSETVGPTAISYDRNAAGGVFFTPIELSVLRAYRDEANPGLWTLTTTRGDQELPVFFQDQFGNEPILMFTPEDWPEPTP